MANTFGGTVKKKFWGALVAGFLALGVVATVFGVTGTAFALPLGGMGDFYVKFDKLDGDGFELDPHIGETGNSDAAPMVRNKIDSATVHGLYIYKDLKMPGGKWIRINIKASKPAKIKGLTQDARFIDANLKFSDLAVEEHNTSGMSTAEAFKKNWGQKADDVTITDGKIVTDYLFQNVADLQGAKISIIGIDGPDTSNGGGSASGSTDDNHHNDQNTVATTNNGGHGGNGKGEGSSTHNTHTTHNNGSDTTNNHDTHATNSNRSKGESSSGGVLPTTSSANILIPLIGGLLVVAGLVFVLRRKIFGRSRKHES